MNLLHVFLKLQNSIHEYMEREDQIYYVGAVVLSKRNEIISMGFNSYIKTHPMQKEYAINDDKVFLHAEIAALVKARRKPYRMLVIRVTRGGKLGGSKPCPACTKAIEESGCKEVFYLDSDGAMCQYTVGG